MKPRTGPSIAKLLICCCLFGTSGSFSTILAEEATSALPSATIEVKKIESPTANAEAVKINYDNKVSEVKTVEAAAAEQDLKAIEQQAEAHRQLLLSAEKSHLAKEKRLELERQNILALETELRSKKHLYRANLREYLKSKCRIDDYQKGEFIHLTPELVCTERSQLGVEYGPQYYQFTQAGDLGGIDSGSAAASQLKIHSHHGLFKDIGTELFLGMRSLSLSTEGNSATTNYFLTLGINAYYKKYYFGVHISQTPIMRYRSATLVEWSQIQTTEVLFGYRHVTRPLFFLGEYNYSHFKLFLGIPISQTASDGITASEVSGMSLLTEGVTTRPFLKDNMRLGLKYFLKYQTLSFKAAWHGNTGKVTQAHTALGLSLFYQYDF